MRCGPREITIKLSTEFCIRSLQIHNRESMKRSLLQLFVISSLVLATAGAQASSRPRYGGSVRVLLHDRIMSVDPLSDEDRPATRDRLAALLFENLTTLDAQGRLQPGLASSWHAENSK